MKISNIIMSIIAILVIIGAAILLFVAFIFSSAISQVSQIDAETAALFGSEISSIQETAAQLLLIANLGIIWGILAIILGLYVLYISLFRRVQK